MEKKQFLIGKLHVEKLKFFVLLYLSDSSWPKNDFLRLNSLQFRL